MGLDKQTPRHRSAPMTENRAKSARPELEAIPHYGISACFPPGVNKSLTKSRLGRAKVHFLSGFPMPFCLCLPNGQGQRKKTKGKTVLGFEPRLTEW